MENCITQNGIKYELRGEQYYPMLEISEQEEYKIDKYGLLHRDYIKQHKRGTYTTLLTEGKLNAPLQKTVKLKLVSLFFRRISVFVLIQSYKKRQIGKSAKLGNLRDVIFSALQFVSRV